MAGLATKAGGGQDIFVFDLLAKSVVLRLDLERLFRERCTLPDEWLPSWGTPEPDWLAPSPNGDLLVVQWPANGSLPCRGLETYALPGGERVGNVYAGHQHGDLGLDEDGRQFFMVYEFEEGGFELSVGYRWLPGAASGSAPTTALVPIAWGNAAHISCQGPPGRCLVSSGPGRFGEARDGATPGWQAFENELWSVSLEGAVERLAHHRSSLDGYWAQPRATWSRDGRFVVFASDWGEARGGANDGLGVADVYVIDRR